MSDSEFPNAATSRPILSRRRALTRLGLTGLMVSVSTGQASAFFWGSKAEDVDLGGLPDAWVRRQGRDLERYAEFLAGLKLKRVTPRQVIDAHAKRRGNVWNSLPPRKMWKNIAPTLKAIDRVGESLGCDASEVVSAYRSPAYNARCRGASSRSWHQSNVAVDVKFPVRPSSVAHASRALRSRGVFKGGIGRYSTFTHIDTRGRNADW